MSSAELRAWLRVSGGTTGRVHGAAAETLRASHGRDAEAKDQRASCLLCRVSAGFQSRKSTRSGDSGRWSERRGLHGHRAPAGPSRQWGCAARTPQPICNFLHPGGAPARPPSPATSLLPPCGSPRTCGPRGIERSPGRRSSASWGLRPAVASVVSRGRAPGEQMHMLCGSFLTRNISSGRKAS